MKKVVLAILISAGFILAQDIKDLIKPLNLIAGRPDSVLISDLFYSKDYSVKFKPSDKIKFNYNEENRMLYLYPDKKFEGIGYISFTLGGKDFAISFKTEILQERTFSYKPAGEFKKINLFGSFNSWNREQLEMKDADKDSVYEITIPLQPGRYEYKFFVDGKELVDPLNPEKFPNGMGDFNSVIIVGPKFKEKCYLHLKGREGNKIKFYYEREGQKKKLKKSDIIVLLNNSIIPGNKISLSGGKNISVNLDKKDFSPNSTLRIAIVQNGYATNIQTVFLDPNIKTGVKQNITPFDKIIYSLMIDRFSDGDTTNSIPIINPEILPQANYNGGDLKGIINKINEGYFDSLGINTIWITPVNDNPNTAFKEFPPPHRYYSGYHGYWPISPTKVDEHFGDMNLLKQMVAFAQKKNIKVLLDYVAHHVHIEHPYWNEHRDWFGKLELPDGRLNLRLWDEQRLTTWFEPYMPSFDFTSSHEALEVMTDNAIWWLKETNIDGFRHDAVKHVPNIFWRRLTEKIKNEVEKDERKIYQIGETFGGYDLISSYVNNGQLDAQFNFNLFDNAVAIFLTKGSSFNVLDTEMKKTFNVYGVNHLMGNLMDSHDKTRFMAMADGDLPPGGGGNSETAWENPPEVDNPESYRIMKLYMAYLNSIPGLPIIYYGDEFGMTGASDPDNRRMMRFGEQLDTYEKQNLIDISSIINLRGMHSALRYGDYQTLYTDDNLYVFMRSDLNERIIIVLNKEEKERKIKIDIPAVYGIKNAVNLLSDEKLPVKENSIDVTVPPVNFLFIKVE